MLSSKLWYINRGENTKDVVAEVKAPSGFVPGAGRAARAEIFLKGNTRYSAMRSAQICDGTLRWL